MSQGLHVQCGKCGHEAELEKWVAGLPPHCFQCPSCESAFRREERGPWRVLRDPRTGMAYARVPHKVVLVPIASRPRKEVAA